jgi:hypothetical protein
MFEDNKDYNSRTDWRKMPIYVKGKEILEVVSQIIDLIPEDNKELDFIKEIMLEDAMMLTAKIANAEGGDLYDLRMENAAIIRKSARNLMVQNHNLEMFGFEHVDYFDIVRDLLEEYRLLFINWVAGFDKTNYIIDRWGLFNPAGVSPFDEDRDDMF